MTFIGVENTDTDSEEEIEIQVNINEQNKQMTNEQTENNNTNNKLQIENAIDKIPCTATMFKGEQKNTRN